MPWNQLPRVNRCCGCVSDLKTATAIIAVLGIVSSPAVSWAVVRHAYVIRVSCVVTTSATRADVVDINLNHILSFGFGANAGLGPSCLGPRNSTTTQAPNLRNSHTEYVTDSGFVNAVRWIGWIVLIVDIIFLCFSVFLLYKLFKPPEKRAVLRFMTSCVVAITLSFVYGMLYVAACLSVGGAFPIFEFIFCIIDVMIYSMWIYFLIVEWSYFKQLESEKQFKAVSILHRNPLAELIQSFTSTDCFGKVFGYASRMFPVLIGLVMFFLLVFSVDLLFNSS